MSSCENTPEPGNRFRLRLRCVRACVRACVRSCASGVIPQWLGSGRRICGGTSGLLSSTFKVNLASCKSVYHASHIGASQLFW